MIKFVAALCLLAACARASSAEQEPGTDPLRERFAAAETRLLEMTSPPGWVVSRYDSGEIEHTGDSLIWTGMAMGVLSCEGGQAPEAALLTMLEETGGTAYRHPSEAHREPSLDGQLGFYWGVSERVTRCPETKARWAKAMASHRPLNLAPPFSLVLDALKHQLDMGPAPSAIRLDGLAGVVSAWASVVVASKEAAFRIHLGLLALEMVQHAPPSTYCAVTKGIGMPTVDHFCGRSGLVEWIDDFEFNRYEMALQRAKWESADGRPGLNTPAVDLLAAMRAAYDL